MTTILIGRSSKERYGVSYVKLGGERKEARARKYEQETYGDLVDSDWSPATDNKHMQIVTQKDVERMLNVLIKLGFANYVQVLTVDYYAERPDQEKHLGPVMAHFESDTLPTLRETSYMQDDFMQQYIENAFKLARKKTPKIYKTTEMFIPRIIVSHPLIRRDYVSHLLQSLNPAQIRQLFSQEEWDRKFEEIVDLDYRQQVKADLEAIIQKAQQDQPAAAEELMRLFVVHGLLHEALHPLALHMPPEWENEFEDLIFNNPKGRVEFKNWLKALDRIKKFRTEGNLGLPDKASENLMIKGFLAEMFCDLFSMYLLKKADTGERHVYEAVYGEVLSPELEAFFERMLELLQGRDKDGMIMVFDKKHLNTSGMHAGHNFIAALIMEEKDTERDQACPRTHCPVKLI